MILMLTRRVVAAGVSAAMAVVGFLAMGAVSVAQVEDTAKGAALLAEARKAVGGEEKLAAISRLQVKGEMRRGQGNVTLEGETEVFVELPDKFRRNESLSLGPGGPGIDRVEVLNGNESWEENTSAGRGGFGRGGGDFGGFRRGGFGGGGDAANQGGGGQAIDPERLREAQRRNRQTEVARLLLGILLTTDAQVAWIGTAQSPEGTADVLEVKTADGAATRLFLESATHLPLMMTWTTGGQRAGRGAQNRGAAPGAGGGQGAAPGAGQNRGGGGGDAGAAPAGQPAAGDAAQGRRGRGFGGAPVTLEMHLSEYKAVNGVKLPHLITRGTNGETAEEWAIKSYRINPNFKGNTFTK